ncbi:HEPN domain-containing protein [Archaeoglobus sp.]
MKRNPLEEGRRWLLQAERDLDDAEFCLSGKRYNLACFLAQQASEKALKAFLYAKGEEIVFGHSVAELLKRAMEYDESFKDCKSASVLDKYYIPTRYPNGLPGGVPYEAFDEADAKRAIELAKSVIEIVKKKLEA